MYEASLPAKTAALASLIAREYWNDVPTLALASSPAALSPRHSPSLSPTPPSPFLMESRGSFGGKSTVMWSSIVSGTSRLPVHKSATPFSVPGTEQDCQEKCEIGRCSLDVTGHRNSCI